MGLPASQQKKRFLLKLVSPIALLGLSIVSANYLVNSREFWNFMEWVPRSVRSGIIESLGWLLSPIWPAEVHEQEEQLELIIAWLFSGVAVLALYFSLRALKAIR